MRKLILAIVLIVVMAPIGFAQKDVFRLGIGVDVNIPSGDFAKKEEANANVGFGPSVKAFYGVSKEGSLTLTAAMGFHQNKDLSELKYTYTDIMIGYRHSFSGFYLEPQVGFVSVKAKLSPWSQTNSTFSWAMGIGYEIKGFDLGVRYQSQSVKLSDLYDGSRTLPIIGIRVGYNFSLGSKTEKK